MIKRGLLIIDCKKSTTVLSPNEVADLDLVNLLTDHKVISKIKRHEKLSDLDKTVRQYLKGEYNDESVS